MKTLIGIALLLAACPLALAQAPIYYEDEHGNPIGGEFAVGIGYANISIGGSDSPLNSMDALHFDPVVSFSPIQNLPQLRLGAGFGVTLVLDNSDRTIVSNGGVIIVGHSSVPLWTFEPDLRASWRQYFRGNKGVFIEPGVAGGWTLAHVGVHSDDTDESFSETESTFSGRAFINIGTTLEGGGYAGLQASYLRGGDLDFGGNASGEIEEFYIGIFGAFRF